MDLTICTSCRNYGRYLGEWADSILASKVRPAAVAMVDNGSTDGTPGQVLEVARRLREAGIPVEAHSIAGTDFGTARNRAVSLSQTEWVMHLDADDMLMPHGLGDAAELAPQADVVGFGYERCGDLAAGPRNRKRLYTSAVGEVARNSSAPCSGVSPFRRRFWERRPYRTDMAGGWDTALWRSFARLGARFKATRRPCFLYRQHADSVFNLRRNHERKGAFTGRRLEGVRRGDNGVSIVVPWRPDGGERDRAWAFLQRRYAELHPDCEVLVGSVPEGEPWRKGLAVQAALSQASGEFVLVADADCILPPEALAEAVELLHAGAPWVVPHTHVVRLAKGATAEVLAGDPAEDIDGQMFDLARPPYEGYIGGGMLLVRRADYEASGGIPSVFVGWGAEDEALGVILDTLVGEHVRLEHDLIHLWHPPTGRSKDPGYIANRRHFRAFQSAAGQPDAMWRVVQGGRAAQDGARVRMVTVKEFMRGAEPMTVGAVFVASEVEARRHAHRKPLVARPVRGSGDLGLIQAASRQRTLDIRAEQRRRNEEATAQSLQQRKLAEIGRRVRPGGR